VVAPAPVAIPERRAAAAGAAAAPAIEQESGDLAGSLIRYHRFVTTLGWGTASLAEVLAGPPADPAFTAAEALEIPEPEFGGRRDAPAAPVATAEPVPITALCYSGPEALRRAMSLREELRRLVTEGAPPDAITELAEEVFDLVQLGLDGGR
jgi:hypothetical protein